MSINQLEDSFSDIHPVYEIPDDDLVGEVLIPALSLADTIDISVGFFSSHSLSQIAPGLASLIERDITCRLLVSPEISREDRDAIERGTLDPGTAVDGFMIDLLREPTDALASHTADCLAFLIATGTLELRCVLMDAGMFHKKVWLFESGGSRMSVHGSGNMTARGLFINGEQMTIDRPWMDGASAATRVDDLANTFEMEWSNRKPGRLTITPHQLVDLLKRRAEQHQEPPTTADFWEAWVTDSDAGLAPALPPGLPAPVMAKRLTIPDWLDWKHAPYAHQQEAVDALRQHGYVALIAMATGGGKTKTALIAASQLQDQNTKSLLVVIVVPTRVLAAQWADEVRQFGVNPTVLSGMSPDSRGQAFEDISRSLHTASPRTEVLISTLGMFTDDVPFRSFIDDVSGFALSLLIADEAHNFGAPGFIRNPPHSFQFRIGLSATPVRQYDAEGTAELYSFFNTSEEPAFAFTLGEAIRSGCLTPYRYHLHPVTLTDEEMERYRDLTDQLGRAGFGRDEASETGLTDKLKRLLRERRALTEQASGKIECLRDLLIPVTSDLSHTLIYCSAKAVLPPHDNRQIDLVRSVLSELRITTHMYTSVETGRASSQAFLRGFATEEYQTLLAMKVLDEGVDVPAAHKAFLLASSTVEREWIQRRGRILRKSPGKSFADLHDFIVLPPESSGGDGRSLAQSELRRAEHFTMDAMNKYDDEGPRDVIKSIEQNL